MGEGGGVSYAITTYLANTSLFLEYSSLDIPGEIFFFEFVLAAEALLLRYGSHLRALRLSCVVCRGLCYVAKLCPYRRLARRKQMKLAVTW